METDKKKSHKFKRGKVEATRYARDQNIYIQVHSVQDKPIYQSNTPNQT